MHAPDPQPVAPALDLDTDSTSSAVSAFSATLGAPGTELPELIEQVIHLRQHLGPKHLIAPGPSPEVLRRVLRAATAAPDHRQLRPWRLLVLSDSARARLAEAFAQSLLERDPAALPEQLEDARRKAWRGPVLLLAIVDFRRAHPDVLDAEKLVALGCAIQNLMLATVAHGFACGLTTGRALASTALREAFDVQEGEQAVCFLNIGTAAKAQTRRPRPELEDVVRWV